MKPNLLFHIIPTLGNGGAETVLSRLVEELSKLGWKQYVISIDGDEKDHLYASIAKQCPVILTKKNSKQLAKLFGTFQQGYMLGWMYKGIQMAHWWKFKYQTSHKIIWNIRRSSFQTNDIKQKLALYVFGVYSQWKKPSIIYCAYQAQKVHKNFGFFSKNATVIQNRLAKKINYQREVASPYHRPFVLYVGRYNRAKGPDRLLKLMEAFLPNHPTIDVLIAGNKWEHIRIPDTIAKQVFKIGNIADLTPYYANSKALLFTSYTEGYPNVLVEAAVCGTPIVGFSAGDSEFILNQYAQGYTVTNESQFIATLNKIITHPINDSKRVKEIKKQRELLDFGKTVQEYHNFISPNTFSNTREYAANTN